MLYHVTIDGRVFRVEVAGDRVLVDDDDAGSAALAALPGTPVRHLLLDGRSSTIIAHRGDDGWDLHVDGWPVSVQVIDERTRAIRAMTGRTGDAHGPRPLRAPMPGLIVRIEVQVGDAVTAGQPIVAMEAMKMENELKADSDGVVARIMTEAGHAVEKGMVLVEFEAGAS
ncbi:MAG: biotin/lipoyl-containing protein [Gemmatimonadota bacterium]